MLPSLLSRDQEPHCRAAELYLVAHSESRGEADALPASGPKWGREHLLSSFKPSLMEHLRTLLPERLRNNCEVNHMAPGPACPTLKYLPYLSSLLLA